MKTNSYWRDAMKRSSAFALLATSAFSIATHAQTSSTSAAQAYPAKPIRLIMPTSPGGTSDILGRIIAQKLTEAMGQQVIAENRAGAGGVIGVELVVKAPPDGYTILITPASLAINPSMFIKLPYNAQRDLAPITQLVAAPNVLSMHPSVPARDVKALIALAKLKPGNLVSGSAGVGTSPHLSAELFRIMSGADITIVNYKGAGQGMIGLLSGEIGIMFPTITTVMSALKANRLRALGVTTLTRAPTLPDVPTLAEAGLPGYEATQWFGMLAPAKTPRPVIDRLNKEIIQALRASDVKPRLDAEGADIVGSTPDDLAAYIRTETEKWAKVVKAAGIKPQ